MITRKTKFRISIEKVNIEFEGSQELGQQIHQGVQQAIGGLMNTQTRLLSLRDQPAQAIDGEVVETAASQSQTATDGKEVNQKQPRQRRSKSGSTVANLLDCLKQEKYFAQPRTGADVQARLKDKGHNPRQSNVLTGLQRMAQKNELYRENNDENVYTYKDSPFHDSPRSPSPTDRPAE